MTEKKVEQTVGQVAGQRQTTVVRKYRKARQELEETLESSSETMVVRVFATAPARVKLGFGLTLNQGNFESVRIDVGVELPCYAEEVDEAYQEAMNWVETRIGALVEEVKSQKASTPKRETKVKTESPI